MRQTVDELPRSGGWKNMEDMEAIFSDITKVAVRL